MPQTVYSSKRRRSPTVSFWIRVCIALGLASIVLGGTTWARWKAASDGEPPVYAALGASDAVGVGADRPEVEGWAPLVHAGLPAGTRLLNLGISGATLEEVLRDEVPPALDARPRWVSLWPGINDLRRGVSLPVFAAGLDTLLGRFETPQPRGPGGIGPTFLLLNIPDLRPLPAFKSVDPRALDAAVRQWNSAIADMARRHKVTLVDLYSYAPDLLAHPEYISADGFHPSSAGYRRVADLVLAALKADVPAKTS